MARQNNLIEVNGRYYCRVYVPKSLQAKVGRKEVWRSLKTSSFDEARYALKMEVATITQAIQKVAESNSNTRLNELGFSSDCLKSTLAESPAKKGYEVFCLRHLVAAFNDSPENQQRTKKHIGHQETFANLAFDVLGKETPVSSITRQVIKTKLWFTLEHLPVNATKRKEFSGLSRLEIAHACKNRSDLPKLSVTTRNDYLEYLNLIFGWGMAEQLVQHNPIANLRFKSDFFAEEARLPFQSEFLKKLYLLPEFQAYKNAKSLQHRYWVILISLYTGMRLGEILQLRCGDVLFQDNAVALAVNIQNGKKVKTVQSIRKVVLPNALLRHGLAHHLQSALSSKPTDSLWPHYKPSTRNFIDPFSKWFTRFRREHGIGEQKKHCFHSFRHNYRDFLRNSHLTDVEMSLLLTMCGWKDSSVHARYGSGASIKRLKEAVEKVMFPSLT